MSNKIKTVPYQQVLKGDALSFDIETSTVTVNKAGYYSVSRGFGKSDIFYLEGKKAFDKEVEKRKLAMGLKGLGD